MQESNGIVSESDSDIQGLCVFVFLCRCHGGPGFISTFSESAVLFSKYNQSAAEKYLDIALSVANVTWDRGLLVKGTMYCHGIGGNINMLWYLGHIISSIPQYRILKE